MDILTETMEVTILTLFSVLLCCYTCHAALHMCVDCTDVWMCNSHPSKAAGIWQWPSFECCSDTQVFLNSKTVFGGAVKPLLMFHIKGKDGTYAVSCHKVVLAWETCQQEGGGKETHFVLCYLLGEKPDFMAGNTICRSFLLEGWVCVYAHCSCVYKRVCAYPE